MQNAEIRRESLLTASPADTKKKWLQPELTSFGDVAGLTQGPPVPPPLDLS